MARVKNRSKVSDKIFDQYDKIIEYIPELEMKGKANPYTSYNGHMFSFLGKDEQLCLRLSPEDQAAYEEKHNLGPVMAHGSVMNGYVYISDEMFWDAKKVKPYLLQSFEFVKGLKKK